MIDIYTGRKKFSSMHANRHGCASVEQRFLASVSIQRKGRHRLFLIFFMIAVALLLCLAFLFHTLHQKPEEQDIESAPSDQLVHFLQQQTNMELQEQNQEEHGMDI